MNFATGLKMLPLIAFSFTEMSASFVRMLVLTHIIGPYEFGFAAALSATYATFEQITDIAIYRFVLTTPRSSYVDAVAGAHAFALIRGGVTASLIIATSYPIACTLASCSDWSSFAWLAPVTLLRSFENLQMRVAERDYKYRPQLIASITSHAFGLIALTLIGYTTRSHYAFIVYLIAQASAYVLASHLLASSNYQINFRSAFFGKAWKFSLPLVANGIGLAIMMQGDRLMVGTLFGLTFLGMYAVIMLCALVPLGGLLRVSQPLVIAGLHNSSGFPSDYANRLRLFSRACPLIAASYALFLMNVLTLMPLLFGAQYAISDPIICLVASIAFFRLVRAEPHTALLLQTHNTRKLAIANQTAISGLITATVLAIVFRNLESVLIGILVGEIVALFTTAVMTRRLMQSAMGDYLVSLLAATAIVIMTAFLISAFGDGSVTYRALITSVSVLLILTCAAFCLPDIYRKAYGLQDHQPS